MSESTLRIAPRDTPDTSTPQPVAPPRRMSATLTYLGSAAPLDEFRQLTAEIAEDLARLNAKIATKNMLEVHLRLAGQIT
jgi:hypothetical protein